MGKTSFLQILSEHLDSDCRVAIVDFQAFWPARNFYGWVTDEVAKSLESMVVGEPGASEIGTWVEALAWLKATDRALAKTSRRLLVALDEVERLQDGIQQGWATPELLDFIRAAGDALTRIRFLLVTAYPLHRLGPDWVDRLINVLPRSIGPLSLEDAEGLIRRPIPEFPEIYPDGGVERILEATGCHPYLVQFVCDRLCFGLNEKHQQTATLDDVEAAMDAAFDAPIFDELWRQRTVDEKRVLRQMASGAVPAEEDRLVVRGLEREGFTRNEDGGSALAVPIFGEWIAERALD